MSPKSYQRVNMQKLYETLALFISKLDLFKFNDAVNYIHDIKTQFSNNPDEYDSFGKTLQEIMEARISYDGDIVTLEEIQECDVERIRAKLQGQRHLLATFDTYLPRKHKSDHSEIETEKVLSDNEVRSLSEFSDNNSSNPSTAKEVEGKKRKNIFEKLSVCDSDADKDEKKIGTVARSFLGKVRNSLPESTYIDFLESLYNYCVGNELEYAVEKLEKYRNFPGFVEISPSYIVAESCPSSIEFDESEFLNYLYKCKSPRSLYTHKRKINEKEEIVNKIEDDQLQLNLLIEWFRSAIIYAKFLLEKDHAEENLDQEKMGEEEHLRTEENLDKEKMGEEEQLKKELNEHNKKIFEKLFIRCLEEIDEDYIIKDLYQENPKNALPVILCRFQLKLKEFLASKKEHDRICREAYEKHFSSKKKENSGMLLPV